MTTHLDLQLTFEDVPTKESSDYPPFTALGLKPHKVRAIVFRSNARTCFEFIWYLKILVY